MTSSQNITPKRYALFVLAVVLLLLGGSRHLHGFA